MLLRILRRRGINNSSIKPVKTSIEIQLTTSEQEIIGQTMEGLRKSGVPSPTLFNIYIDDTIKESNKFTKGVCVSYENM